MCTNLRKPRHDGQPGRRRGAAYAHASRDVLRRQRAQSTWLDPFTLALLRHRERTREQLGEEHASRFADRSVDTNRMLRHLTRLGHIVEDDQSLVGITPDGEKWLDAQTRNAMAPKTRKARVLSHAARAVLPLGDKPLGVIAPSTGGRARPSSAADNRLPPMRPGSEQALSLPSRIGDYLHYRNGLITDMAGQVIQAATRGEQIYQPTRNGDKRARPVYPSNH